ncbi:phosphatidylserine/phosphatidylglycerophosphate/cardiolipin synthase family protein [Sinorhizobium medicae]|nr:phosphatidylserine/phosphatidylglycerophosphate/cardiolipin synthase family protein [Sinorhizobium medicae]
MNAEELFVSLQRHIEAIPNLSVTPVPDEAKRWLAAAFALVEETGDITDATRMRNLTNWLSMRGDAGEAQQVLAIMYRRLAVAELRAPASVRGAFINAGNAFDAIVAVGRVLSSAQQSVRIVDPYMDEKALTDFALLAPERVRLELLADGGAVKPSLEPAARRFAAQYSVERPLEVRLTPARALHDRLIVVDGGTVWTFTQSLNALAARSPASIVRIDGDAAPLKIQAYDDFWNNANVLV